MRPCWGAYLHQENTLLTCSCVCVWFTYQLTANWRLCFREAITTKRARPSILTPASGLSDLSHHLPPPSLPKAPPQGFPWFLSPSGLLPKPSQACSSHQPCDHSSLSAQICREVWLEIARVGQGQNSKCTQKDLRGTVVIDIIDHLGDALQRANQTLVSYIGSGSKRVAHPSEARRHSLTLQLQFSLDLYTLARHACFTLKCVCIYGYCAVHVKADAENFINLEFSS